MRRIFWNNSIGCRAPKERASCALLILASHMNLNIDTHWIFPLQFDRWSSTVMTNSDPPTLLYVYLFVQQNCVLNYANHVHSRFKFNFSKIWILLFFKTKLRIHPTAITEPMQRNCAVFLFEEKISLHNTNISQDFNGKSTHFSEEKKILTIKNRNPNVMYTNREALPPVKRLYEMIPS